MKKILVLVVLSALALVACAPASMMTRRTTIVQDITDDGVSQSVEVTPVVEPVASEPTEPAAVEPAVIPMVGTTIHAVRDIEVGDTTVHLDDLYTIPAASKSKPWVETDAGKATLGILGILVGGAVITAGVCGGTDACNGTITLR